MFQTEPVLALQSIPGEAFRQLMLVVSQLGAPATGFLAALVLLNIDLRKGFLLTQVLAVTAIVTTLLKQAIALPRPLYVDGNIAFIERGKPYPTRFFDMGADGFFDPLPPAVVDLHRTLADPSWGFPSGHVSATVALCLALVLLYRRNWLIFTGAAFAIVVAVSRVYLGKHFLADVLGGALLGTVIAAAVCRFAGSGEPRPARERIRTWLGRGYLVVLPMLLLVLGFGDPAWYASLLGVNMGYLALRAAEKRPPAALPAYIAVRIVITALLLAAAVRIAPGIMGLPGGAIRIAVTGVLCLAVIAAPGLMADRLLPWRR